jgi:hypothetical protein
MICSRNFWWLDYFRKRKVNFNRFWLIEEEILVAGIFSKKE